jgi:hypothetical protein
VFEGEILAVEDADTRKFEIGSALTKDTPLPFATEIRLFDAPTQDEFYGRTPVGKRRTFTDRLDHLLTLAMPAGFLVIPYRIANKQEIAKVYVEGSTPYRNGKSQHFHYNGRSGEGLVAVPVDSVYKSGRGGGFKLKLFRDFSINVHAVASKTDKLVPNEFGLIGTIEESDEVVEIYTRLSPAGLGVSDPQQALRLVVDGECEPGRAVAFTRVRTRADKHYTPPTASQLQACLTVIDSKKFPCVYHVEATQA